MSRSNQKLVRLTKTIETNLGLIHKGQIRRVSLGCPGGVHWLEPKDYGDKGHGLVILTRTDFIVLRELPEVLCHE